jgi:hypothetical protein
MLADEPVLVALAGNGLLLRESTADRRKGKLPSKLDDRVPITLTTGSTHDEVFLFAADGRVARLPVHRLPENTAIHPADLGAFVRSDRLVAALALDRDDDAEGLPERFLVLATRDGRVKRVTARDAWSIIGVSTAMNVEEGDELIGVALSDGVGEIVLATKLGQAIRFTEAEVRPMGLPAAGVWGIKLSRGDEVVSLAMARPKAELVIATTNGFFKRTPLDEYPVQGRHGGGVAAIRLAQNSGAVADARVAGPSDEFFSASRRGTLRKIDLSEIPAAKRSAQGRLLVQPAQGDTILTLLHLPSQRSSGAKADGGAEKKRRPAEPASQPSAPKRAAEFEFDEASLFDVIEDADLPAKVEPPAKPEKSARGQGKPLQAEADASPAEQAVPKPVRSSASVPGQPKAMPAKKVKAAPVTKAEAPPLKTAGAPPAKKVEAPLLARSEAPPTKKPEAGLVKKAEVKLTPPKPAASAAGKPGAQQGAAPAAAGSGKITKQASSSRSPGPQATKPQASETKAASTPVTKKESGASEKPTPKAATPASKPSSASKPAPAIRQAPKPATKPASPAQAPTGKAPAAAKPATGSSGAGKGPSEPSRTGAKS